MHNPGLTVKARNGVAPSVLGSSEDAPTLDVDAEETTGHEAGAASGGEGFWCAALVILIAAAFHSGMSLSVKVSSRAFPFIQILWARYAVQLLCTSAILLWRRTSPLRPSGVRCLLAARGVLGMLSQGCHIFAASVLPLADAVSIHSAYPVVTALIAPRLLGESLTAVTLASTFAAVAGCTLIAQGRISRSGGEPSHILGLLAAALGSVLGALTYVLIRRIMRGAVVNPEVVVWAYSATACSLLALALPFTLGSFVLAAPPEAWAALLAVGATSVVEQQLVTLGFRSVPAGVGTLLLTTETAFAFLFGAVALHEPLQWKSAVGACFIAGGVGCRAVQQARGEERRDVERVKLADPACRELPVVAEGRNG